MFSLIFILILGGLSPCAILHGGLTFGDTGYNYANFQYMGLEHMDSMWLFSTYFANAVGNLLTKLPFAGSLAGMNFYTGLSVSLLAVGGYLFCTKKLGIGNFYSLFGRAGRCEPLLVPDGSFVQLSHLSFVFWLCGSFI